MTAITVDKISMRYGDQILFEKVSLQLLAPHRYGVIGANGSGKSTFLRLLAREEHPFAGALGIPEKLHVGYLKQDPFRSEDEKVLDLVLQGKEELWNACVAKDSLLARENFNEEDGLELARLEEIIAQQDGYYAPGQAGDILSGLGIPADKQDQPLRNFSGGYKLRVELARLLFSDPDVLLLDEPTNHLDILSIDWLETYLARFKGMVLLVSHDHLFLNRVVSHILDVDYGQIRQYAGNYERFTQGKEQHTVQLDKEKTHQDRKRKQLQDFVDRFGAKATKATQAKSKAKQLDRMEIVETLQSSRRKPALTFPICRKPGEIVLTAKGIRKSYGDLQVLNKVGFQVSRGEKIALIGANGIGKSTLLKILMEAVDSDAGQFEWGYECYPAYVPQEHSDILDPDLTALDWLWNQSPSSTVGKIRSTLGRVLISGDDAEKKVQALSGGEACRLILAKWMLVDQNILVLDEPTNHLDLESIEALKDALKTYKGTLILVSHNRYLVSALADRIFEIQPEGIVDFHGSYHEYLEKQGIDHLSEKVARDLAVRSSKKETASSSVSETKIHYKALKELRNRERNLAKDCSRLENKVHELESLKDENLKILFDAEAFRALSVEEQTRVVKTKDRLEMKLQEALKKWEGSMEFLESLRKELGEPTN
jgi:ATPase subunit of ABC transporter with duplicated ATPase domains